MSRQSSFRQQSRRIALCGLMVALAAVILLSVGLIPLATFACPMLAMICLLPLMREYGPRVTLVAYTAVALIALFAVPDKELAMFFVAIGYYPAIRPTMDRIHPCALRIAAKCGLFSIVITIMYAILIFLFRLEAVVEEFKGTGIAMLILLLVLGNVTFLLFDRALAVLALAYDKLLRKKLFHGVN